MNVFLNGKETELPAQATVHDLALSLQFPPIGIALAVNNRMVPRNEWGEHPLAENDRITLIKASCGG